MNTNPKTIRILAFGDSNTWGRIPGKDNSARYTENIRWTGLLQNFLGNNYEIIEEGLNGRTTNIESPHKKGKNGKEYLLPCLESHKPIDIVILALGKNDFKAKYNRNPEDIAKGLEECIDVFKKEGKTRNNTLPILIILSTCIINEVERIRFGKKEVDFLGANEKSKILPGLYSEIAKKNNAIFIDLSNDIKVSSIDGVHIDYNEHKKIANILFRNINVLKIT